MSLDERLAAKKRLTPKSGFNVVAVDTFEPAGDELYLVSHHATRAKAEAKRAAYAKEHPMEPVYVYEPTPSGHKDD